MGSMNEQYKICISSISNIIATTLVYPFDTIRIKMHLDKEIHFTFRNMYKGYTSGILRQLTYSTPNIYIYSSLYSSYKDTHKKEPELARKFGYGVFAGAIAGLLGTPSEVIMVRDVLSKTTNGIVPISRTIWQKYGASHFFKGCFPTMFRSMTFNSIKLSMYSEIKPWVSQYTENKFYVHSSSAFISTTLGIVVSNPLDVIKSRMQKRNTGFVQTFYEIKNVGMFEFYKGFAPSMMKSVPHSIVSFVLFETLSKHILNKELM